jgi:pullulanase
LAASVILAACITPDNPDNPDNPVVPPVDPPASEFEVDPYDGKGGFVDADVLPKSIPAASSPSIKIHYFRKNANDYKTWGFWLWEKDGEGQVYALNYQDDFGGIAVYPLSTFGSNVVSKSLGLIARKQADWTKDGDPDRFILFSGLKPDADNYYNVYLVEGDINIYYSQTTALEVIAGMKYGSSARFDSDAVISVKTDTPVNNVRILAGSEVLAEAATEETVSIRYNIDKDHTINLSENYTAEVTFLDGTKKSIPVAITALFSSDMFNDAYYYDGELGAIYSANSTTFKVWSPLSNRIVLNIYQSGHLVETPDSREMAKGEKGVFEVTVSGDLGGKYYTYTVFNATYNGTEIVDPYAKSAGLSGVRGQIVDFSKTNPDGWNNVKVLPIDKKALTVWETHVSDVTSSTSWIGNENYRKKFLGMTQAGTTYTQNGVTVTTGFDHIKELGVNAVQLVPIFDQANDETKMVFNWGYNPLNYNVLEGSYSTDPTDGYVRIREFKQLVAAYNAAGINIIMDVVYNHVNAAGGSNFDVLMPGYYFRYTDSGALSNGSGCGNETASENRMMRKFIVDSVKFLASEYKLGGFRFDLMGLHDINTMNMVALELMKINPTIAVYGEPWTAGTTTLPADQQSVQKNANALLGVGQFNDQIRDSLIKGGLNGVNQEGWATAIDNLNKGDVDKIISGLQGITDGGSYKIANADQTINYVTCHDNYTLYDRVIALVGSRHAATAKKMAVLANSVVLTSHGTSFMLAGDEFLRSKGGDENSYQSSYEVNELDYSLKITNADVFEIYKTLVAFKQDISALHLNVSDLSKANYSAKAIANNSAIEVTFTEGDRQYKIVYANGFASGLTADFAGYTLVLDTLGTATLSSSTAIQKYQTIIAYK